MASVYPAEMRATRDLLRRRGHLMRKRSELLTHIQNTNSLDCLPPFGNKIASRKNRDGVAGRFADPSVCQSMEVDLELIDHDDRLLNEVELSITRTAKVHDVNAFSRLRSVPGIGKILALGILYEVHDIARFPTVQDFASSARLVKCPKESAGKRHGSGGAKIGHVHLKWALSEASVLFLRQNPPAQRSLEQLASKHGKAKALSILAHKLGRAVYYMLHRREAFDMKKFLSASAGRGRPSLTPNWSRNRWTRTERPGRRKSPCGIGARRAGRGTLPGSLAR